MKLRRSAFIVTKPFQYINATNISETNIRDLYLIPNFNNFERFYHAVKSKSKIWNHIYVFKTKELALLRLVFFQRRYENVYLDSDFGLLLRILLFLFVGIKIYVYEEGVASYTYNLRNNETLKSRFRSILDRLFLGSTWSGSAYKTVGIYLYHKKAFLKLLNYNIGNKSILSFNKSFTDHIFDINEINYLFENINFNKYKGIDVLLYLSAGSINKDVYPIINSYPSYHKILKLHPFQKDTDFHIFNESIDNSLPAEILIYRLNYYAKSLIVVHESSAAILNIVNDINLFEINIGEKEYAGNFNYLKSLFIANR